MKGRNLARWIMLEVHGVEIPRKPPVRSSHSTKPKIKGGSLKFAEDKRGNLKFGNPMRDWKYRSWIRSLPCAACGCNEFIEAAHTGSDGGFGQKSSDYSCIPLCAVCHRVGPRSYHTIGKQEFETLWQLNFQKLSKRLHTLWMRGKDNWD